MIWLTRVVPVGEEQSIRELFRCQRSALGHPASMMLVSLVRETAPQRLYVCIPDLDLMPSYYGFARVATSGLPRAPSFLEGDRSAFEEVFQS